MQVAGQGFARGAKWNFNAANLVIGELNVLRVALVLFVVEEEIVRRVLEDRPLRSGVEMRGEEVGFARGKRAAVVGLLPPLNTSTGNKSAL